MTDTIAIRKKVAELSGFSRFMALNFGSGLGAMKGDFFVEVPPYELSLDAITQAFDEHGFSYTLSKRVEENSNKLLGYFAIAGDCDAFSDTAPKAMCYLFIKLMEAQ